MCKGLLYHLDDKVYFDAMRFIIKDYSAGSITSTWMNIAYRGSGFNITSSGCRRDAGGDIWMLVLYFISNDKYLNYDSHKPRYDSESYGELVIDPQPPSDVSIPGMVGLSPKWVRLSPNGTNPGLFQIRFQCIWRVGAKCTEIWSEKAPDLSHLGPIWPNLEPNLPSLCSTL